jgi:phenylalanyl-tRNA synthetase alpha chain
MKDELKQIKKDFEQSLKEISDIFDLEKLKQKFFSRKSGVFTQIMKDLKDLDQDTRKEFGKLANIAKRELEEMLVTKEEEISLDDMDGLVDTESIDVTQPELPKHTIGHLHPITQIQYALEDFFRSMGFMVLDGPELESEYYNFDAINIPVSHPARDMQDTFFVANHPNWVMRTHTSAMQIRGPREYGIPLRMIVPGKCFRNEATDARHEHTFHQVEGVVIDKGINFAHMKGVLEAVARHLYGEKTNVRLRPKYYPFVEPGVNGEVTCFLCGGNGCRVCKNTGWIEIFGAGSMHPNVLKEGGVDTNEYQGFAFGFGLDRLAMLKYGIEDIRLFNSGDLRFVQQF